MRRFFIALLVCLIPALALAQPLADRVPEDALLYFGWSGSKSLPDGFQGSHFQAVLDASNIRQVFDELIPSLMKRIGEEDRQAAEFMELLSAIGGPMWRHPSAIYVGDVDLENPDGPRVQVALLCQAGDEAQPLLDRITGIINRAGNLPFPVQATAYGDLVAVTVHRSDELDALLGGPTAVAPAPALAKSQKFIDTTKQVHSAPAACVYVDVQGITAVVDRLAPMSPAPAPNAPPDWAQLWPKIRDALGLPGLHRMIWACGFDGKDFASHAFVAMPAPRKGLLASLVSENPVSDDILKTVPADATLVSVGQFDAARFFTDLRTAIGEVDVNVQTQYDEGVAAVNDMLGMNVHKDLLSSLGREWAMYCSPSVAGSGIFGFTLVNRLNDAARAEQSIASLENLAQNLIAQQTQGEDVHIDFRTTQVGDLNIHYLAVPFVAPAWAVKDGNLYIGLYPQVVAGAAGQAAAAKSILDNPQFAALRDRLGGANATAIGFMDLPATASEGYQTLLMMSQTYMGLADLFGVQSPAMIVPPLNKLMPHLAPAGGVTWVDDAGWHMKGVSPFPGAELMGSQSNMLAGQNMMMLSMLLPSLNRARETANRVKCASNLRQIGMAIFMYANERKGDLPSRMGELLLTQDLPAETFICPSSNDVLPDMRNMKIEELAEWIDHNSSYVYLGEGKRVADMDAEDMLACEHADNHGHDGMNVLYGDGRVEFVPDASSMDVGDDADDRIQGEVRIQSNAFFSDDDGQTWFADDITKLAPFEHNGKTAYRVYVFTCDGGKTKFVSHLERYTDEAKKKIEELRTDDAKGPPNPMMFEGILMTGIEVKDPGAAEWIRQADFQRAQQIMMPVCPDGTKNNLEAVFPD